MQQDLFDCLAEARSRKELVRIEPKAQWIYWRYRDGLVNVNVRDLAIHRRVRRLNYPRRCAEASAVKAHQERGIVFSSWDGDRLCGEGCWEMDGG